MRGQQLDGGHRCQRPDPGYGGLLWVILLGFGLSVAAGLESSRLMARSLSMPAAANGASAGRPVDVIVRVVSAGSDALDAELLRPRGSAYVPDGKRLHITSPRARILMGGGKDLQAGAVLEVKGVSTGTRNIDARELVILTGYVQMSGDQP